ncbi:DNA/RNA helicase domain-containing protein [[Pseudomonas] boreopolis]|uniref:DNA/RNA helicase domain-containing protein n=1 Tax=Xanthomonas boreopolis TaxID=86183 RepID=UPI003DA04437
MIVYQSTRSGFLRDSEENAIEDIVAQSFLQKTGRYAPETEFRAWRNSLMQMVDVLSDDELPDDMGVGIEFGIPYSAKRIDFILSGHSADAAPRAIIIELKQWSESKPTDKDGIIIAQRGGYAESEGIHPSYQAWSYAALLEGFNEAVHEGGIRLKSCAYLHNHVRHGAIDDPRYAAYLDKAPVFLRGPSERQKLRNFIKQHVKRGDKAELLYRIENGRVRPSKMLADSVAGMLKGNQEFVLIDDQKLVYENCLARAVQASDTRKQVVIVKGGPGTGKSVVAVNLLVELTKRGLTTQYVSKNAAPRAVYAQKLAGHVRKHEIASLFSGSGGFHNADPNVFDVLVVDEAHRLNEKSGLYGNLGQNQVMELIRSARCTIFFVDDDQIVTLADIGHTEELRRWAANFGADVTLLELASQFRCAGSDGYIAWLDNFLGIRETANVDFDRSAFEFGILDSPRDLHELIREKNRANNKSRMVAGYCWDWKSKKDPNAWDIEIPEHDYRAQWNLGSDGSLWAIADRSVEQVGCIHTCQGLEMDYVGVIIGPDLTWRDGRLVTDPSKRSRQDRSIRGYKSQAKNDPEVHDRVDRIIRNTYKTLMSRGMKGCYVYISDQALKAAVSG